MNQAIVCAAQADSAFGPVVAEPCRQGFDFTLLFEQIFFSSVLSIVVIFVSIPYSLFLLRRKRRKTLRGSVSGRVSKAAKQVSLLLWCLIQLSLVVLWTRPDNYPTTWSVPSSTLALISGVWLAALSAAEHDRAVRPSAILSVYLFLTVLFDVVQARTLWLGPRGLPLKAMFSTGIALKVVALCAETVEKRQFLINPYSQKSPESLAGVMNRACFWWTNAILLRGVNNRLHVEGLPDLDKTLESEYVKNLVLERRKRQGQLGSPHALFLLILKSFWLQESYIVLARLCYIGFEFCQPLITNRLIRLLSDPSSNYKTNSGRAIIGATVLVYVGLAITGGIYRHQTYRLITMIRGSMIGLIYDRTLTMGIYDQATSAASALTLMSTDVDRIAIGLENSDYIWAGFIEITIAAYLLWTQIGVAFVAPLVGAIIFVILAYAMRKVATSSQQTWQDGIERRIDATSKALRCLKSIKMTGLSTLVRDSLHNLRVAEMDSSRTFRIILNCATAISTASKTVLPILALVIYAVVARSKGQVPLDADTAFTTLSLVSLLSTPIQQTARVMPEFAGCLGCFQRIQEYVFAKPEGDVNMAQSSIGRGIRTENKSEIEKISTSNTEKDVSLQIATGLTPWLQIHDASFQLRPSSPSPIISGITMTIPKGSFTVVTGATGSGKSMLLHAVLGELCLTTGSSYRDRHSDLAFCAQVAWMPNATIRDIIVNFKDYDPVWYKRVLEACCLLADIEELADGDQTLVGSNALKLSGGQRQRVSLARAVYSQPSTFVLDDVFSGLDATTEKSLLDNLFGSSGLLRSQHATILLATHSFRFAREADHVILMEKGGFIRTQGPPAQVEPLLSFYGDVASEGGKKAASTIETAGAVTRDEMEESETASQDGCSLSDQVEGISGRLSSVEVFSKEQELPEPSKLEQIEEATATADNTKASADRDAKADLTRATGDVRLYGYYLRSMGWFNTFILTLTISAFAVFLKFPTIWVKWWSNAEAAHPGRDTDKYAGIYGLLGFLCLLFFSMAIHVAFMVALPRSSINLHSKLLHKISRAPYWFFVAVDESSLLNRFGQDMSLISYQLPVALADTWYNAAVCLVGAVLITISSTWAPTLLPALFVTLYLLQKFYLRTSRQMRLLDLEARAPLYRDFLDTLHGLATIRAFGWQSSFRDGMTQCLNYSQRPVYGLYSIQRWLNFVLDVIVAVTATVVVSLAVILPGSSASGLGVALVNLLSFSQDMSALIRTWTELETSLGAVARVKEFEAETPDENKPKEEESPPEGWPHNGMISFSDVSSSYRDDAEPILKSISVDIAPGCRVGICGRTGSGKSTFILTLLRLAEILSGEICIDGISVSHLSRDKLRQRLCTLPQETLLLSGTVRSNADHGHNHTDEEVYSAMKDVGIFDIVVAHGGLDIDIGDLPLSQGERQLFGLVRILLSPCQIVIIDEMTSSMDAISEARVIKAVERILKGRTILAIAHHLETIRDFDLILVFDKGQVVESGHPEQLLKQPSMFRQLWETQHN